MFTQSILNMEKHDLFELTEALYAFAVLNHSGKSSELYRIQCEVGEPFKPGHGWSETDVENDNMYYHDITEENAQYIWNRIEYVLDNRWDDMD